MALKSGMMKALDFVWGYTAIPEIFRVHEEITGVGVATDVTNGAYFVGIGVDYGSEFVEEMRSYGSTPGVALGVATYKGETVG